MYDIITKKEVNVMLLSLLSKEEKNYFVDLLIKLISVDGAATEKELSILKKFKAEIGEDLAKYHKTNLSKEKLIDYFAAKSTTIRNLVFYNLVSASLNDDWYSVEEHFLIETIQEKFQITDKKKYELMKQVYAERDLREKIKRIIQEKC